MSSPKLQKVFSFKLIEVDSKLQLELMNTTDQTLKRIEVLTIFLKNETSVGGPSLSHIRFEPIEIIRPLEKAVLSHQLWADGRRTLNGVDQLQQLEIVSGKLTPYVLDISWQDVEGKTRFQRIPVGH